MATQDPLIQKILDKFSQSRDFTISFVLHLIIVMIFGTTVLFHAVQEPPDFEGGEGGFVQGGEAQASAPQQTDVTPQETTFDVSTVPTPTNTSSLSAITTSAPNALNFNMSPTIAPVMNTTPTTPSAVQMAPAAGRVGGDGLTAAAASQIKAFTGGWGKGTGGGTGTRNREFEFTAYIGQYQGGDWNSTVRVIKNEIVTGSLPNLLYLMSFWSKDRIKTNYKNVKAIKLDSDEIFSVKPPFIFLTGTRDFKLTEREVENLQKYVRMGGCIWGDASLPGLRSRFDIAFRREMKRVIPDVDKNFEPLPVTHEIFTRNYFPEVKNLPSGLNYYQDPIQVLRIYGEIGIIYTSNDYGDMWQIGLDEKGQIDLRRDKNGQYVAVNQILYNNRGVYVRNITVEALTASFKFGTNMVVHLLTRWEDKVRTAPSL